MATLQTLHRVQLRSPYQQSHLWGDVRFDIQNMLLRQVNFPAAYPEGDLMIGVYSDPGRAAYRLALEGLPAPCRSLDSGCRTWDTQTFLEFCRTVCKVREPITGARITHCTNVVSGHPVYYIEVYGKARGFQAVPTFSSDKKAPNIGQVKDDRGIRLDSMGRLVEMY